MNCLCCNKPLRIHEPSGWHRACIKRFFGTLEIPEVSIDEETLDQLALESSNKGYTVPGVQKKLSLHLSDDQKPRLTIVNHPTGYILKPQVKEFEALPEAEQLAMTMADRARISTVPHALIRVNNSFAYITKRIDRVFAKDEKVEVLAMEDFCQLDLRLTQDKYRGSYERCAKVITRYSSRSGLDLTELFMRLVFSFLIGNSDMHLKNFSLIETAENSRQYVLSPAYDLLPVNVIMPEDQEQFALPMNGKKTNLRRRDFQAFADSCRIPKNAADNIIKRLLHIQPTFAQLCAESLLSEETKQQMLTLMKDRSLILSKL
jgi:serine/threonine-protein kinase HipA